LFGSAWSYFDDIDSMEWSDMDHFVNLERLPNNLEFPERLRDRIRYDAEQKVLVYHGPMWKRDFDILREVHDCRHYRRAIEELFRKATVEAEEGTAGNRRLALALGVSFAVAVAAFLVWYFSCAA
jgi:hypothetical protein